MYVPSSDRLRKLRLMLLWRRRICWLVVASALLVGTFITLSFALFSRPSSEATVASVAICLVLFFVGFFGRHLMIVKRSVKRIGRCPKCNSDLRGCLSDHCPKCGIPI